MWYVIGSHSRYHFSRNLLFEVTEVKFDQISIPFFPWTHFKLLKYFQQWMDDPCLLLWSGTTPSGSQQSICWDDTSDTKHMGFDGSTYMCMTKATIWQNSWNTFYMCIKIISCCQILNVSADCQGMRLVAVIDLLLPRWSFLQSLVIDCDPLLKSLSSYMLSCCHCQYSRLYVSDFTAAEMTVS